MASNKFKERQVEAEILGELYERLEDKLKDATMRYDCVGKEEEQARSYRTDELLWEDDECTIPKYRDKYEIVPVPENELTDEDKLRIKVIKNLMTKLERI